MKRFILLFLTITLFTVACKKGDNGVANALSGRWNLVAAYISTGAPGTWEPVNKIDGKYVQFDNNRRLLGNVYSEYVSYLLKDSVTVTFAKTDNTTQNYRYTFKKDTLILYPAGPLFCIEGCGLKFVK